MSLNYRDLIERIFETSDTYTQSYAQGIYTEIERISHHRAKTGS